MPLQTTGTISHSEIMAEFGKTGAFDLSAHGAPLIGKTVNTVINETDFYGASDAAKIGLPASDDVIVYSRGNSDNSIKLKTPAGTRAGDLLVNLTIFSDGTNYVNFSGWDNPYTDNWYWRVYTKIATSDDVLKTYIADRANKRNHHMCIALRGVTEVVRIDINENSRATNEIQGIPFGGSPQPAPSGTDYIDMVHCSSPLGSDSHRDEKGGWTWAGKTGNGWGSNFGWWKESSSPSTNGEYKLRSNQGNAFWQFYRIHCK